MGFNLRVQARQSSAPNGFTFPKVRRPAWGRGKEGRRLFGKELSVRRGTESAEVDFFLTDVAFVRQTAGKHQLRDGRGARGGNDLDRGPMPTEQFAVADGLCVGLLGE